MAETGENFGGTPDGDLLHEAWDSGWPSNFEVFRSNIKGFTTKGKIAESILAKYAFEAMIFRFLRATSGNKEVGIWNVYINLFKAFTDTYLKEDSDRKKYAFMKRAFSDDAKNAWYDKFMDARVYKSREGAVRVLSKMASSLDKQIKKFWNSLEDKGVDWSIVTEEFQVEASRKIQTLQFQEASLITSRILEIIEFVNMDQGDDNAKKLTAFYKKIKKAGGDAYGVADEGDFIGLTKKWVDDEQMKIDMTPCEDDSADWDAPCVQHKFDDGYFWYDIKAGSCEISARKLNNCGQASAPDGSLYNLMSYSETGKPRWHVMLEYSAEERAIVQVLGNSNQVPKQEYWPHIKWFYEDLGKPEISNYAWEHVQGGEVQRDVYNFLLYLGLKSGQPLTEEWNQMKQQIDDGFYNVYSFEGDPAPESDFSRLKFTAHVNRIDMSMRIKRRLLPVASAANAATYSDVKDYKNAAKRLHRKEILFDDYLQDMIPGEWDEFFNAEGMTQRVRFSHGGNMMLYFNWASIPLQQMDGGRNNDPEYRNQLQREGLAFFMKEMKQNFSVEAMTKLGEDVGNQLAHEADDIAMSRPMDDLDEESQKILSELLKLSKPKKD